MTDFLSVPLTLIVSIGNQTLVSTQIFWFLFFFAIRHADQWVIGIPEWLLIYSPWRMRRRLEVLEQSGRLWHLLFLLFADTWWCSHVLACICYELVCLSCSIRRQRSINRLWAPNESMLKLHLPLAIGSQNKRRLPFVTFPLSTGRTVAIVMWFPTSAPSQKSIHSTVTPLMRSFSVPMARGGSVCRLIKRRAKTLLVGNITLPVKTSLISNSKILSINVLVYISMKPTIQERWTSSTSVKKTSMETVRGIEFGCFRNRSVLFWAMTKNSLSTMVSENRETCISDGFFSSLFRWTIHGWSLSSSYENDAFTPSTSSSERLEDLDASLLSTCCSSAAHCQDPSERQVRISHSTGSFGIRSQYSELLRRNRYHYPVWTNLTGAIHPSKQRSIDPPTWRCLFSSNRSVMFFLHLHSVLAHWADDHHDGFDSSAIRSALHHLFLSWSPFTRSTVIHLSFVSSAVSRSITIPIPEFAAVLEWHYKLFNRELFLPPLRTNPVSFLVLDSSHSMFLVSTAHLWLLEKSSSIESRLLSIPHWTVHQDHRAQLSDDWNSKSGKLSRVDQFGFHSIDVPQSCSILECLSDEDWLSNSAAFHRKQPETSRKHQFRSVE